MELKADPGEDVDTDPPNVPWPAPPVDAPPPPPRRADTVDSGLLSLTPEGQGVGVDDEDRLLDAEGDVGVAYREALRAATGKCDDWVFARGQPVTLIAFNLPCHQAHEKIEIHNRWFSTATFGGTPFAQRLVSVKETQDVLASSDEPVLRVRSRVSSV